MLRVISGTAKGHKLKAPRGVSTRPTSDRVKESLFNIISHSIYASEVLDLFAGTGNLGIEALSRGADSAVFIDRSQECFSIINENLRHTKLEDKASVMVGDVFACLKRLSSQGRKFDIVFLDPPYNKNLIEETLTFIVQNDIIRDNSIIIAERDIDDIIPQSIEAIKLAREERYGDTVLSFYRHGH
nr:16S rRNA (guanine(966)-N(2))-methyltransferase RsmD [Anaerobacterium chartisolvens]